ncbi:ATP-binding protein [Desulfopila aestuarii]|uniref:histidine kinase n=1 Tax=Desulfopila aestuarii DSM 18488 TaxID=1121416 RepID=A0A1M7Y8U1_9BACT|nr:ATP-binding protein [Desulfopila aestuarii]SHO49040.1 two-component system, OmpR family, sensor histidine kinase BaeS [Desulfopila aestuarii DSM 18488]
MKIRLHYKLFAAILAAILVVVVYMTLVMQWSFNRGFLHYVSSVEYEQLKRVGTELEIIYKKHDGWSWLTDDPIRVAEIIIGSYADRKQKERFLERLRGNGRGSRMLPSGPRPAELPPSLLPRVFLLDEKKHTLFGFDPGQSSVDLIELLHENKVVGYVGLYPARYLSEKLELVFANQQKFTLMLIAAAAVLIAAGLTFPITYMLTRPIREMAAATRSLAKGRYQTRIRMNSSDEFGQLAQDLNDLGTILEKNQIARSQWIADISHELRTPLSILRGKIEALQDGLYQPTEELYRGLHREVMHLGLLVDDLYQLSLSDLGAMSYQRVEVQPCWALEQAISLMEAELTDHGLRLETEVDIDNDASLFADNERLKQLFTNLLANAIRYTDSGGTIRIHVGCEKQHLVYTFEDTAPGVSDEDLTRLFDRLYRVEASRSRELGGAGLGLSICHSIVTGHNGTIEAEHSPLGGLLVRVRLPLSE